MPLRKSPTLTPRRLAANRANAQHSTGPKTARGKARSRWNGLRSGRRSKDLRRLNRVLARCPAADIRNIAARLLTPDQLEHPVFAREVRRWERACEMAEGDGSLWLTSLLFEDMEVWASTRPIPHGPPPVVARQHPGSGVRAALPAAAPRKFDPPPPSKLSK